MSRAGIPVVRVSRQLDVLDVRGPDGPAGCLVDQAPGNDHAAGDLDGRLDRLEPLGIADGKRRGVEVRLDARPGLGAELIHPGLGQAENPESPVLVGPGVDPGPRRRFDPPDGDSRRGPARPLDPDDADDRLARSDDQLEGRAVERRRGLRAGYQHHFGRLARRPLP